MSILDDSRYVSHRLLLVVDELHLAYHRVKCREGLIRYFGQRPRHRWQEGRFSRVGVPHQSHICNALKLQKHFLDLSLLSGLCDLQLPIFSVAFAPTSAFHYPHSFVLFVQIANQLLVLQLPCVCRALHSLPLLWVQNLLNQSPAGHRNVDILAIFAVPVLPRGLLAIITHKMLLAELVQVLKLVSRLQVNVAALAAVSAVGAPGCNLSIPLKREAAIAPVSRLNAQLDSVHEGPFREIRVARHHRLGYGRRGTAEGLAGGAVQGGSPSEEKRRPE